MSRSTKSLGVLAAVIGGLGIAVLGGCAEMPTGPTVAVWPAPGKPFSVFRAEDVECRQYAAYTVNPDAANRAAAKQVAVGTAVGAVAGTLIGDSSRGTGIGAGTGMLIGASSAASASERGTWTLQRQYNVAYEQCMYAKGNQIPGAPAPAYTPPPPPPPKGGGG